METPDDEPKESTVNKITYAPVKKRIHTDMSTVVIGDTKRVLFSPKKQKKAVPNGETAEAEGESVMETIESSTKHATQRMLQLRFASLLYDHIPMYQPSQLSGHVIKKRSDFSVTMKKEDYLLLFRNWGKARDLGAIAEPPMDGYTLFCQRIRCNEKKRRSKDMLQSMWNELTEEKRRFYEEELNTVKREYNRVFKEYEAKGKEGKLPLYEERILSNVEDIERILGPLSVKRVFAGYRTIAGQVPMEVAITGSIRIVYDETEESLRIRFNVIPTTL